MKKDCNIARVTYIMKKDYNIARVTYIMKKHYNIARVTYIMKKDYNIAGVLSRYRKFNFDLMFLSHFYIDFNATKT